MASGVAVSDVCLNAFQDLKMNKKSKFILYKLNKDLTEVVVDQTSNGTYEEFIHALPKKECRYAVFDLEFDFGEGPRSKIVFFTWSPDESKIREKMVYASTKDAIRKKLVGVQTEIQATDLSEVAKDAVLDKVARQTSN
eukprot:NODE_41_length_34096_cov_2.002235.p26 type:complete len:139 gc:universal NODE_41_length_34096_cov_2.002235:30980-31396(+)